MVTSRFGSNPKARSATRADRSVLAPKELTATLFPLSAEAEGISGRTERVEYFGEIEADRPNGDALSGPSNCCPRAVDIIQFSGEQRFDT
jgi:hypothetical protein